MRTKGPTVAIVYDFDGTLAPGNMQDNHFLPAVEKKPDDFWKEVKDLSDKHEGDNILMYMRHMLKKASQAEVSVRRSDFSQHGESIDLFEGVEEWFNRIRDYGKDRWINVEHYLVSSGNAEIIRGTRIAEFFSQIYASKYAFDENDVAVWPALAINYTTKTQYLFRINKGCHDLTDNESVNKFVPKSERPVPFENMIYIGDGLTDVPCFRLVRDQGGLSIAVYKPNTKGAQDKARIYLEDGRVQKVCQANYQEGSDLDKTIKSFIRVVEARTELHREFTPLEQT